MTGPSHDIVINYGAFRQVNGSVRLFIHSVVVVEEAEEEEEKEERIFTLQSLHVSASWLIFALPP